MPTLVKELWRCDRCGKVFADDRGAAEGCEAGHGRADAAADFGRRMRAARTGRRLTPIDVARALGERPTPETLDLLAKVERGEADLPAGLREAVATFLGIDP